MNYLFVKQIILLCWLHLSRARLYLNFSLWRTHAFRRELAAELSHNLSPNSSLLSGNYVNFSFGPNLSPGANSMPSSFSVVEIQYPLSLLMFFYILESTRTTISQYQGGVRQETTRQSGLGVPRGKPHPQLLMVCKKIRQASQEQK